MLRSGFARNAGIRPATFFLTIWFALLFSGAAVAQLYTGSATGIVQDPTGAVIPNASVTLVDTGKGLKYPAITDSTGRYVLRSLPPSTYNLRAEASGFRPEVQNDIVIAVNQ